ncbi:MAG: serine/threonine protein kinase, partial [Deltaproteobacteria bacterium]|nr:serine/threonine protein kinase [Deltaproteobacteria bacterium]
MPRSGATTPSNESFEAPSATATMVDDGIERRSEDELLERGQVVGRYVILEQVGAGGMGVVYAAYDRDLDRRVALKLLHSSNRPDRSKGQARLLREAQAMARLSHPNVVGVHEVRTFHNRLFVAMEFVDGQTLGQWNREQSRSWREVLPMMVQAGRGLAAAHQQGLVHRDFKPENVLVGHDGRARVVDFGLARSVGELSREESSSQDEVVLPPADSVSIRLTETGALAGTPAYMAPEQHRGQSPEARTDQFAFCVTLWEALYGERPFRGDTRMQLAMAVCRGTLAEPTSRDVPAFVRRVLRRGLAVDIDERFPTMDALLDALDRDPIHKRRRVLVAGFTAVGIAALSATAARWTTTPSDPCTGGEPRLEAAWNDTRRGEIQTAFTQVDAEFAQASLTTVVDELDAYATQWRDGYRDACEATHVRHEQSTALLDRRMICLSGRLAAMDATAGLLAHADREAVTHSVRAATGLPSLEECARTDHLMARFAPPEDPATAKAVEDIRGSLARAQALGLTGQVNAGL